MDEHCKLQAGEIFKDFDCLLNFAGEKSDRFYRIQVLKNHKGFHVWTRWGRNGTGGQSKLDGPLSQANAEKKFKKKFLDKTKNNWDKRQQFTAVKGKYTLVQKTDSSQNSQVTESQKPELKDAFLSKVQLPVDVLYAILSQLPMRDVLRYMQVCKTWKTLLSYKYFWKMYIQKHFDLGIKSDLSNEGPMARWSSHETAFKFISEKTKGDVYIWRPFPSMWNCRVFHPYGLDPFSGDARSLQGFCRSLEILTYMRSEASRLGMLSSDNPWIPKEYEIGAVIFPWDERDLPTPLEVLNGVFHFHPKYHPESEDNGQLRENKLPFHVPQYVGKHHHCDKKTCLNRIFGMNAPKQDELWRLRDSQAFYEWLQPIMYPSVTIYVLSTSRHDPFDPYDHDPFDPDDHEPYDPVFMLTQLAPGWVGGALTRH